MNVTTERTGEGMVYRAEPVTAARPAPVTATRTVIEPRPDAPAVGVRDTLRWGPVVAGLVTTIASMLVLAVLGLAVGLSTLDPNSSGGTVGTFAAIWTAASALISFFLGGWITGRTAGIYKPSHALLNGVTVGTTALVLMLWLTSSGVGNLLGTLGTNIGDIARLGVERGVTPGEANAAQNARDAANSAYDNARNSAWGTLGGLALALGASAVGGYAGFKSKSRREGDLQDAQY